MKNQIKTFVTALLFGLVFYTNANTLPAKPSLKTYALSMYKVNGESAYNIFINKLEGNTLKITLRNLQNEIVYEQFMGKNETKFRTKLNLRDVDNGKYFFEVTDGNNIETKALEISNKTFGAKTESNFVTGIIQSPGSTIVKVNIDKLAGAILHVYLRDNEGNTIVDDIMQKNQVTYRTKFNLAKLEKGKYTMEITDGTSNEVKHIDIQ